MVKAAQLVTEQGLQSRLSNFKPAALSIPSLLKGQFALLLMTYCLFKKICAGTVLRSLAIQSWASKWLNFWKPQFPHLKSEDVGKDILFLTTPPAYGF